VKFLWKTLNRKKIQNIIDCDEDQVLMAPNLLLSSTTVRLSMGSPSHNPNVVLSLEKNCRREHLCQTYEPINIFFFWVSRTNCVP